MLLFNVRKDPSEAYPLTGDLAKEVQAAVLARLKVELSTFTWGTLIAPSDGPGEGPNKYGICCSRDKNCDCDGPL